FDTTGTNAAPRCAEPKHAPRRARKPNADAASECAIVRDASPAAIVIARGALRLYSAPGSMPFRFITSAAFEDVRNWMSAAAAAGCRGLMGRAAVQLNRA